MSTKTMLKGLSVTPGYVRAKARVIKHPDDLENIGIGEIVVLPRSHPMYAIAMMKAVGVICEIGGKLSHICLVAMEMGIPCVTQVPEATKRIPNGKFIVMDSNSGEISLNG